jgi:hypothetical protein
VMKKNKIVKHAFNGSGWLFLSLLSLPFFLYSAYGLTLSIGLTVDALALLALALIKRGFSFQLISFNRKQLVISAILLIGIALHGVWPSFAKSFDVTKFYGSLFLLTIVVIVAIIFLQNVLIKYRGDFNSTVYSVFYFLIIISVAGFFKLNLFSYVSQKSVLFFSEPSYFALTLAPFLIFVVAKKHPFSKLCLVYFLIWALIVQNLTMLAIVFLAASLLAKSTYFNFIKILFGAVLCILVIVNTDYFSSRLDFGAETDNLSVLVFLQGWQNSLIMFRDSSWVGVGFQQFGIVGKRGEISDQLENLGFKELNIYDGGTTASKFVGEFGLLGVIFLIVYLYVFIRTFLKIKSFNKLKDDPMDLFFSCSILAFSVELFVRGIGYFSPGCYLFLFAMLYKYNSKSFIQKKQALNF